MLYDQSKRVHYEIVSLHCSRKIKCHFTFELKVLLITSAINSKKGEHKMYFQHKTSFNSLGDFNKRRNTHTQFSCGWQYRSFHLTNKNRSHLLYIKQCIKCCNIVVKKFSWSVRVHFIPIN